MIAGVPPSPSKATNASQRTPSRDYTTREPQSTLDLLRSATASNWYPILPPNPQLKCGPVYFRDPGHQAWRLGESYEASSAQAEVDHDHGRRRRGLQSPYG